MTNQTVTNDIPRANGFENDEQWNFDRLAALDMGELANLYGRIPAPKSLRALDMSPCGRVLTFAGIAGTQPVRGLMGLYTQSKRFFWVGKNFSSVSDATGHGINRLRVVKEFDLFRFTTRIEPSVADGRPAVLLDYKQPGNPFWVRCIRDELRELQPGLFFGPAYIEVLGKHILFCYFAVQS